MTRTAEAVAWQLLGVIIAVLGVVIVGYVGVKSGLELIQLRPFFMGLAGCFLALTGGACFIAGRVLRCAEAQLTFGESMVWGILAALSLLAGAVVLVLAWRMGNEIVLDRLATGLSGAFAMMFGVLCLLGQRVMSHMHDGMSGEEERRARGARA